MNLFAIILALLVTGMGKPNRLIQEKSPYLLQHAYNPVDWYPWGEEAFEKARKENKPILVSIGYSTCHWCHVMEQESFSKPEIADVMNKYLVSIKLDREERPDLDKIYMTAVTAMVGSGGWPLNVFLTPDLKPFYGGTYFPPESRWGQVAWPVLIEKIGQTWQNKEEQKKIVSSAEELTQQLKDVLSGQSQTDQPDLSQLKNCFNAYQDDYDSRLGGFGAAPKFPMPVNHNFLLRYYEYAQEQKALNMVTHTLREMAKGGIYDHVGGGFHRYSTDAHWHIPHFEKMLYDNAQLAINYLEAYQITKDEEFARVARETLDYVMREMTHREGAFYSAEDADSLPPELAGKVSNQGHEHKSEGAYYLWEKKEVLDILGSESGELFSYRYGIEAGGNAASDPHGEFKNKNILYIAPSLSQTAEKFGLSENEVHAILDESRKKLFEVRSKRPRPHLDDKVLTSWNGLMISAFSRGHQILREEKYLQAAERAAGFIQAHLYDSKSRQLYRRWREGEKKVNGIADDYAFLIQALLDLYETGFDPKWLEWAIELAEKQNELFYDQARGGFYMTDFRQEKNLILRVKEDYDNVEPSASSVSVLNLLRLEQFTGRGDFGKAAEKTLRLCSPQMKRQPRSLPQMVAALHFALTKPYQIVIAGDFVSPDTQAFIKEVNARFIPNKILMVIEMSRGRNQLVKLCPFAENFSPIKNRTTVYVCINDACKLPTDNLETFKQILDQQK